MNPFKKIPSAVRTVRLKFKSILDYLESHQDCEYCGKDGRRYHYHPPWKVEKKTLDLCHKCKEENYICGKPENNGYLTLYGLVDE